MTSQYLMHCVLRKTLCTTSSVSERGDMDSENHVQCCDPEHRITLCEINSIKTDNIDEYIINIIIKSLIVFHKKKKTVIFGNGVQMFISKGSTSRNRGVRFPFYLTMN